LPTGLTISAPSRSRHSHVCPAELRHLDAGRADLLAEVAGIFEGASEGRHDEPLARCAASLCRKARADPEAIPAWVEEGRRRTARARQPPFSGGLHGGGEPGGRPDSCPA
jgi:hypothetical protein